MRSELRGHPSSTSRSLIPVVYRAKHVQMRRLSIVRKNGQHVVADCHREPVARGIGGSPLSTAFCFPPVYPPPPCFLPLLSRVPFLYIYTSQAIWAPGTVGLRSTCSWSSPGHYPRDPFRKKDPLHARERARHLFKGHIDDKRLATPLRRRMDGQTAADPAPLGATYSFVLESRAHFVSAIKRNDFLGVARGERPKV